MLVTLYIGTIFSFLLGLFIERNFLYALLYAGMFEAVCIALNLFNYYMTEGKNK